jgi:hypothetical protein
MAQTCPSSNLYRRSVLRQDEQGGLHIAFSKTHLSIERDMVVSNMGSIHCDVAAGTAGARPHVHDAISQEDAAPVHMHAHARNTIQRHREGLKIAAPSQRPFFCQDPSVFQGNDVPACGLRDSCHACRCEMGGRSSEGPVRIVDALQNVLIFQNKLDNCGPQILCLDHCHGDIAVMSGDYLPQSQISWHVRTYHGLLQLQAPCKAVRSIIVQLSCCYVHVIVYGRAVLPRAVVIVYS